MRAEAACAAWQAVSDYDPSLSVPFSAFARQRVLTSTLTRYRQEWAYAFRSAQEHDPESSNSKLLDSTATEVFNDWPVSALARLSKPDLWLIEQLFLRDRTEADIATQIGITQPAISKRKRAIVMQLRRIHRSSLTRSERLDNTARKVGLLYPSSNRNQKNK